LSASGRSVDQSPRVGGTLTGLRAEVAARAAARALHPSDYAALLAPGGA